MVRSVVSKVMWVGRATVFLVGLAVILALVFGAASAALGANGQAWILGQPNVATAITSLGGTGGVDGPMVRLTNSDADANDTALDLRVQSGEAPMRVNSERRVANLNADQLDGVDSARFIRWASIYERDLETTGGAGPNETATAAVGCDSGDTILSGGFTNMDNGTHLIGSFTGAGTGGSHFVQWRNNATVDTVRILVKCADTNAFTTP
jgi:hypothetical protein